MGMKESLHYTQKKAARRSKRVRARMHGTQIQPRLSVHISNRHITAQCIDDDARRTLIAVHDVVMGKKTSSVTVPRAHDFGKKVGELAREKGIERVIFDRGSRAYHGRVKAFAEGAREGGLKF